MGARALARASRTSTEGITRAHLLDKVGHWEALVQQTQLARLGLLVLGVSEDASVEQCSVNVGDHGSNVASAIRLARSGELDRIEVLCHGPAREASQLGAEERRRRGENLLVEVKRVALVERVDLATRRDADVGVGENELSDSLQSEVEGQLSRRESCAEDQYARCQGCSR